MIIEESDFLRPRCTHAQKSWRVLELRPIWVSLALQRITSEVATRYFFDTRPIPTACSASWLDQRQKKTASCVNIKSAAHPAGSPVCARPPTGVHRPKNSGCIRRWKRKKSADGAKEKWRKNHSIFFPYPSRPANSFRNNKRSWAEFMSAKSLNNNSSNIQVVRLETWTFEMPLNAPPDLLKSARKSSNTRICLFPENGSHLSKALSLESLGSKRTPQSDWRQISSKSVKTSRLFRVNLRPNACSNRHGPKRPSVE